MCIFFVGIAIAHVGAIPESAASQSQVKWPSVFTGDPGIAPTKTCAMENAQILSVFFYNILLQM